MIPGESKGKVHGESEFVAYPINVSRSNGLVYTATHVVPRDGREYNRRFLEHDSRYLSFFRSSNHLQVKR